MTSMSNKQVFWFKVKEQCEFRTPLEDKIRVMVRSSALKSPISTRLIPSVQMTPNKVLGEITKVLQSNEEIPLDQSFVIDIIGVKAPTGSRKSLKVLDYSKDTLLKKSIITIRNKDNLCCGRALAVGKALADKHPKLQQLKMGRPVQKKVALELFQKANILPGPCGLREISKFQGSLPGYQIIVIDFHARNASIYEGPRGDKKIVLYKNGDHFNVVNPAKLPAFHGKRFFCQKCKSFFQDYRTHPCFDSCHTCLRKECLLVSDQKRTCPDCFKFCRSARCFEHHKKSRKLKGVSVPSKCETSFKCQTCSATVDRKRQDVHKCGEHVCHVCKEYVLSDHLCYLQCEPPKEPNEKLLFYDFETDFSSGEHVVNFAVAQYADGTEFVFKGYDSLHEFCNFVFSMEHMGYCLIAHNAKGFDAVLIQRWLFQNRPTADMHVTHSGQKIIQLTLKDYEIRLIDSLNFLQMPLSKFPETFGLDLATQSKGDFSVRYNILANQDYVGPMPSIDFYDIDTKKDVKKRNEFIAWHKKLVEQNYIFDFQKEMYKYCAQDVTILRVCCVDFRKTFLSETGVDPFCYCTIAAAVMAVYRSKYLKQKTIGIIPKNLYRDGNKPFSKSSIEWLEFIASQTNTKILHAVHGGEKAIVDEELGKTYYVDGFCEETRTVYEFYGCVYHGCPLCFDGTNDHPFHSERKMSDVYEATIERKERLRALGFTVKTIWEHDYRKLRATDEMQLFLDTFDIITDLDPRDSFFGGRVGGYKLFRETKNDEKIKYADFTSLYPYVNKTKVYPTGHVTIIRENFEPISNYFGLIKCKVLAPANLYHPVLPVRAKGKLFFPLCKQCVMDNSSECRHSEEERSFWGTFTTIEVEKAFEKGYKIVEIHEVWHFENTSSSLFSEYVNYFLRLKQESSGFPEWVRTPEDQERYIDEYYKHEGILLRKDKIVKNPGLRAFAKLCLNSLWGRFAMRTDRVMTEFITDPLQFYKRINGADIDMHDLCLINDDLVELVYKRKHEYAVASKVTNLFIGIFTTAWARLELYNLLDLIGENVLYVDTDSCVYVSKPGDPQPVLGDFLGDLTDEITPKHGPEAYITQFVCGGPKNYAYKVSDGRTHCKIRGFTLNYKNSLVLNFDTLKEIVCKYGSKNENKLKIVNECKISREKWTRRIVNKREVKEYQVVFDKRVIVDKGQDSIPYGYHWNPSTSFTIHPTVIPPVPHNLLYTLIHPSDAVGQQSTEMNLMEYDNPVIIEQGEMLETDNDCEPMETERDIDLMDTDDESDNDFESVRDSDIEFMNEDESEEELSFYRRFDSTV